MSNLSVKTRKRKERIRRRRKHVRKTISGTAEKPRLVIYRSNKHIYAQLVDDENMRAITGCSSLTPVLKDKLAEAKNKTETAKAVGAHIAGIAKEKGISQVCFDRNGRLYHGRVKALAEGARKGGLKF